VLTISEAHFSVGQCFIFRPCKKYSKTKLPWKLL